VAETIGYSSGVPVSRSRVKQLVRGTVHFFSYHFLFNRRRTKVAQAAGFWLIVRPTVFHPKYFKTSEAFASFVAKLDLTGKHVADVGTGSGILALAAARSGARSVVALDINPNAVRSAEENARQNSFGHRVTAVCSNLLSALPADAQFDVILSNPPYFPGEPRDLSDRAWHAGPNYRDIAPLFEQARQRLAPGGRMYLMLSSDSDLDYLGGLVTRAHMRWRLIEEFSIVIEKLVIYELRAIDP
jgi:release factor glutamine methyltransferase